MTNEELALAAQGGDTTALWAIYDITKNLATSILVKRYGAHAARYGHDRDDLRQLSLFVVFDAVRRYDPAKGLRFNTFLSYGASHVMREALGWKAMLKDKAPPVPLSLNHPIETDSGPGAELIDLLADPTSVGTPEAAETTEAKEAVTEALGCLAERERDLVRLRYYHGRTLQQVADLIGVTRQRAHQIEKRSLDKLRTILAPQFEEETP